MKDCLVRALKTFIQAFLGTLIPRLTVILEETPDILSLNLELLYALLPAAIAAGISAVWNIWLLKAKERRKGEGE